MIQKEKMGFLLVALLLVFITVDLIGYKCLDSKANTIIL